MDPQPVLAGEFGCPQYGLFADSIHGVDADCERRAGIPGRDLAEHLLANILLHPCVFLVEVVQERERSQVSQAHLRGSLLRLRGEPVHVVERGRAGLDHFEGGHEGPPVDERLVKMFLDFPDVVEPVLQDHIFTDATHQGHRSVCVHVHETRYRNLARAIYGLGVFHAWEWFRLVRRNPGNHAFRDENILAAAVQGYVFEKDLVHLNRVNFSNLVKSPYI